MRFSAAEKHPSLASTFIVSTTKPPISSPNGPPELSRELTFTPLVSHMTAGKNRLPH